MNTEKEENDLKVNFSKYRSNYAQNIQSIRFFL